MNAANSSKILSAKAIDGRRKADDILAEIKTSAAGLKALRDITPGIAVVIVGDDPASKVYVAAKGRAAKACGFHSVTHVLPGTASSDTILKLIGDLNADPNIHGILVQLPLPSHVDPATVIQAISPAKDVDGFHYLNVGRIAAGSFADAFIPCTPAGAMKLLEDVAGSDLSGLNAVVVGRSNIVGKPMAHLLLAANATVTVAHSRSADLAGLCRTADILVAAVGKPRLIRGDWIKPGAIVIDVGINRVAGSDGGGKTDLVGDVAFDEAIPVAAAITPVPGGVGPMTIAMLIQNTLRAATISQGVRDG
ncbi:bifunctional 5,10-methylenetetrahydrofolate dehydrogenase/5,10-methenyltetrahydrofolate cyclohydrolase [Bradyrhizobium genosp. P]|uniref:bifunctional 5,10-methylenetetrahydrofolate dehydrogenase/5,10-methenyltetrahydrofolate cyclohydrolase n=1 Tax=Bradyrhizobium genosp. P TaxID=83641 RepID=UPI003CE6912B